MVIPFTYYSSKGKKHDLRVYAKVKEGEPRTWDMPRVPATITEIESVFKDDVEIRPIGSLKYAIKAQAEDYLPHLI